MPASIPTAQLLQDQIEIRQHALRFLLQRICFINALSSTCPRADPIYSYVGYVSSVIVTIHPATSTKMEHEGIWRVCQHDLHQVSPSDCIAKTSRAAGFGAWGNGHPDGLGAQPSGWDSADSQASRKERTISIYDSIDIMTWYSERFGWSGCHDI